MESGRIIRLLTGLIGIGSILAVCGCIEHHYVYKFNRDGVCDFSYTARGDSLDIYYPPGSSPDTLLFHTQTWTEEDTAGSDTYVLQADARLGADQLPRTLGLKESPWTQVFLHHPINLRRVPLFFFIIYDFRCTFEGRNRTSIEGDRWKYIPEECHLLESEADSILEDEERQLLEEKYAAGMLIWNVERYKLRVREILDRSFALHTEISIPSAWVDSALVEVDSLIDAYAASIAIEELDLSNLEWWDDLAQHANEILLENLNLIGDTTLQSEILNVGELLEMRHRITEDLLDESFEIEVELPGYVLSTNAAKKEEGILGWKFNGETLADNDFPLRAFSIYIFFDRIIGALVLILAIYLGVKFKRPNEKQETPEPVSSHGTIPPTGHG